MSYTEEVLDKLNKRELIGMVISLQSKETEKNGLILEEICKLNDKFSQLESENVVIKKANSLLANRLVDMERQCWANAQYSRRECIEVVGIPNSINNNELEDKVLTVFQKIGCELSPRNFEACHRLRKNSDRIIVKFSHRKDCEQIMKKVKMQDIGLPGNQSIFINTSLCPCYRIIWSKCKRLQQHIHKIL